MKTQFLDFLHEKYNTLQANLYEFFENLGLVLNIIENDRQTLELELLETITKKEEWWPEFQNLVIAAGYDIYLEKNKILLVKDLGPIYIPNEYNTF